MSITWMNAVWQNSKNSGSALLMMIAIADHTNEEGLAYPSIKSLARKCRVSERQARRVILECVESGELECTPGQGIFTGHGSATNLYRVRVKGGADVTLQENEGGHPRPRRVTPVTEKGDIAMSYESERIIIEPSVAEAIASRAAETPSKATITEVTVTPKTGSYVASTSTALPTSEARESKATKPRPRDELFDAIAELCKLDVRLSGSLIGKTATNLRKVDATPEQIEHFARYWYAVDFRGLRGSPPAPPFLVSEWRKALEWKDTEPVSFITVGGTPGVEWRYVPSGERVLRDENTKTTYRGAEADAMAAKFGVTA